MLRQILDACLTAEQRRAGLYLEEDEDFIYLKRAGRVLALFNAKAATVASIRDVAERHLERG